MATFQPTDLINIDNDTIKYNSDNEIYYTDDIESQKKRTALFQSYNNDESHIQATNVQLAIDELANKYKQFDGLYDLTNVKLVPWSTGTDEEIAAMIDAYYNGNLTLNQIKRVWHVGDSRPIQLPPIPVFDDNDESAKDLGYTGNFNIDSLEPLVELNCYEEDYYALDCNLIHDKNAFVGEFIWLGSDHQLYMTKTLSNISPVNVSIIGRGDDDWEVITDNLTGNISLDYTTLTVSNLNNNIICEHYGSFARIKYYAWKRIDGEDLINNNIFDKKHLFSMTEYPNSGDEIYLCDITSEYSYYSMSYESMDLTVNNELIITVENDLIYLDRNEVEPLGYYSRTVWTNGDIQYDYNDFTDNETYEISDTNFIIYDSYFDDTTIFKRKPEGDIEFYKFNNIEFPYYKGGMWQNQYLIETQVCIPISDISNDGYHYLYKYSYYDNNLSIRRFSECYIKNINGEINIYEILNKEIISEPTATAKFKVHYYYEPYQPQQSNELVILDFDHDILYKNKNNKNKALITVQFKSPLSRLLRIGDKSYYNCWNTSVLQSWLNNIFYEHIPSMIRQHLLPSIHYCNVDIKNTINYIWLISTKEILQNRGNDDFSSGTIYQYYLDNREKYSETRDATYLDNYVETKYSMELYYESYVDAKEIKPLMCL